MNYNDASIIITPNAFKAGKLYAVKGADLNVSRATSATRVNANVVIETMGANVPLIDYSGGGCPTILVQPQRTNLLLRSQDFDNSIWSKDNVTVTANSIISPDGTQNADSLIENSSTGYHFIQQTFSSTNQTYTYSIFAKNISGTRKLVIREGVNTGAYGAFDLVNGVVSGGDATCSIENIGNGWYICRITFNGLSGTSSIQLSISNSNSFSSYAGNGTSGFYIFGAQVEAGSYATSYIPTTSSIVTRNADVISKTGISSLIGQTEGTMFIDANISTRTNTRVLLDIQDGTNNDSFQFVLGGNTLTINIYDGGVIQASLNGGFCLGNKKIALGYKSNDFVLYVDGVQISTDTSGTIPATSLIALGYLYIANGFELGDTINSTALWKTRLSNSDLETLTTI